MQVETKMLNVDIELLTKISIQTVDFINFPASIKVFSKTWTFSNFYWNIDWTWKQPSATSANYAVKPTCKEL